VSIGESWFFLVGYHVILLDVVIWIICKLIRSYYWMWLYWVAQLMFLGVSVGEFAITLIWVTDVLGVVIIKSILIIIILLTALHIIHLLLTVTVSARVAVFVVIHWSLLLACICCTNSGSLNLLTWLFDCTNLPFGILTCSLRTICSNLLSLCYLYDGISDS